MAVEDITQIDSARLISPPLSGNRDLLRILAVTPCKSAIIRGQTQRRGERIWSRPIRGGNRITLLEGGWRPRVPEPVAPVEGELRRIAQRYMRMERREHTLLGQRSGERGLRQAGRPGAGGLAEPCAVPGRGRADDAARARIRTPFTSTKRRQRPCTQRGKARATVSRGMCWANLNA